MATRHWCLIFLALKGSVLFSMVKGAIKCECTTDECRNEGKSTCSASHFCYSEYFKDTLTRGCIDEGSSLLCENRKPKGIDNWPSLFCCSDHNFCNRDVVPTLPTLADKELLEAEFPSNNGNLIPPANCQDSPSGQDTSAQRSNSDSAKVINPIYIAVPVAGVCVLLALIIFAMYLLRRRNDHYESYHHYHDHLAALAHGKVSGHGGVGAMPPYYQHHHCDCVCKKTLPPCGGKVNRCTDSERSSSGSETKLFLQA